MYLQKYILKHDFRSHHKSGREKWQSPQKSGTPVSTHRFPHSRFLYRTASLPPIQSQWQRSVTPHILPPLHIPAQRRISHPNLTIPDSLHSPTPSIRSQKPSSQLLFNPSTRKLLQTNATFEARARSTTHPR